MRAGGRDQIFMLEMFNGQRVKGMTKDKNRKNKAKDVRPRNTDKTTKRERVKMYICKEGVSGWVRRVGRYLGMKPVWRGVKGRRLRCQSLPRFQRHVREKIRIRESK